MATKTEQPMSVEQRLTALYKLQTILTEIDRIRTIRGELPIEVKDLEDHIEGLKTRVMNINADIEASKKATLDEKNKIADAKAKVEKYDEQIKTVRNNKEYDILSKEIEFQQLEIQLAEKHLGEYARIIDQKKGEIKVTEDMISDAEHVLTQKKAELDEIVSETKTEEEDLREQAKQLEDNFDDERLRTAFKRIRKNARNGLGIVTIERNACGGCFNRIPPQKQTEIRMHKKVIVCEYCGRILIDPELTH
ncbi:MAG: C4-type zinc ribbon domain-containing protein [Bacteroides sp.]|nr:C4-type zinc ribbon domain-containing protein [Bacteroides sp.]MCM1379889.1 C4-type zinc ribbon domain-containing protein [Bacteroides sp.]MCM1446257.1 C4-type zinc ribbon domain-containing protein [Prevotella sp.]